MLGLVSWSMTRTLGEVLKESSPPPVPSQCPLVRPMWQGKTSLGAQSLDPLKGVKNPRLGYQEKSSISKEAPLDRSPTSFSDSPLDTALSKYLTFKADSSLQAQHAKPWGAASLWLIHLGWLQTRSGPAAGRQELANTDCPAAWPRGCCSWGVTAGKLLEVDFGISGLLWLFPLSFFDKTLASQDLLSLNLSFITTSTSTNPS